MNSKKLLLILIAFAFMSLSATAQIMFQKTYENDSSSEGYFVKQTQDGGYIITGNTSSRGAGSADVYLIRINSNGDTLWTKTYGGTNYDDGEDVEQTSDGGYIIIGGTESFGFATSKVYLIKTNSTGDTLWTRTYGGSGSDWGYSGQQTSDGGYIISGYTYSYGAGGSDAYLIKTNSSGDTLWTKTYGASGGDWGDKVKQTTDGGYIIAGYTTDFGAGNENVYLIKTNSSGDTLWTKTFGGTTGDDAGYDIQLTSDGGYIIAGTSASFGAGGNDMYLIKTNSLGDTLWTKTYGGTGDDYANSVQQTSDGGYIFTGSTGSFGAGSSDVYLIKTNSLGDTLWTRTYGGTGYDWADHVQQTADKGYIISGSSCSFGDTLGVLYLIKTDSIGNSGCHQGSTSTITGSPHTQVTNPATLTSAGAIISIPGGLISRGGAITTICTDAGMNEIAIKDAVSVYPDPANSFITIHQSTYSINQQLFITNLLGEEIYRQPISNSDQTIIDISHWSNGVYFYQIRNEKEILQGKFIIQK